MLVSTEIGDHHLATPRPTQPTIEYWPERNGALWLGSKR